MSDKISYTEGPDGILYPDLDFGLSKKPLSRYGKMRLEYLKNHRKVLYTELVMSCSLGRHLEEIDQQALDMEDAIIQQLKEANPLPDDSDFMTRVRYNNAIAHEAEETVLSMVIWPGYNPIDSPDDESLLPSEEMIKKNEKYIIEHGINISAYDPDDTDEDDALCPPEVDKRLREEEKRRHS